LEELAGGDCGFFPSRVPIGQFFLNLIRLGAFMVDVKEVPGHENGTLCVMSGS
jgi:hypothetical protein